MFINCCFKVLCQFWIPIVINAMPKTKQQEYFQYSASKEERRQWKDNPLWSQKKIPPPGLYIFRIPPGKANFRRGTDTNYVIYHARKMFVKRGALKGTSLTNGSPQKVEMLLLLPAPKRESGVYNIGGCGNAGMELLWLHATSTSYEKSPSTEKHNR